MKCYLKMKNTKGDVYIKDFNGLRTNDINEALEFKSKDDAEKQLSGMSSSGKVLKKNWIVHMPGQESDESSGLQTSPSKKSGSDYHLKG